MNEWDRGKIVDQPVGRVAIGSLIKAFCRGRQIEMAVQLLKALPKERVTINMYNTVLGACATRSEYLTSYSAFLMSFRIERSF